MNESVKNPNEPHKLTDDELESVTGGASWLILRENDSYDTYLKYKRDRKQFKDSTYEEFLQYFYRSQPDYLKCRDAWIAAGRPRHLRFNMGDDGVITSEDISWSSLI